MKTFIYKDYKQKGKVIFQCQAEGILEADKKYEEATGKDPEKQCHVGCEIILEPRS